MNKRSLFIFFILILSVFFSYQTAHASILYQQPNDGTAISAFSGADTIYTPANTTGILNAWNDPVFYYTTTPIYFMRYETSNCGADVPLYAYGHAGVYGGYGATYTPVIGTGYCDETFPTPIPSGVALSYFVYQSGTYTMQGSGSNSGYSFNGNTGASSAGGPAFQLCDAGGCGAFVPPPTATRFQDITPADGTTTGSTSVVVSTNYLLNNPDLANYETPPVAIKIYLHRTDTVGSPDQTYEDDTPVYNTLTSISHTFTLPTASTWELRFDLSGDGYYFVSPLGIPTTFHVVSDPSVGTTGYTTCSITDIAGCMQNALIFLFYPSSASVDQFNGLYNQFINKPPFGYIFAIQNALKGINDTAMSAFTLQSLPILNTYLFDPIRLALAWVLWVAFAFVLYHRLKNIAI